MSCNIPVLHHETICVSQDTIVCEVCRDGYEGTVPPGGEQGFNQIVLCFNRDCDRGFHQACLYQELSTVPEGDWLCPLCISSSSTAALPKLWPSLPIHAYSNMAILPVGPALQSSTKAEWQTPESPPILNKKWLPVHNLPPKSKKLYSSGVSSVRQGIESENIHKGKWMQENKLGGYNDAELNSWRCAATVRAAPDVNAAYAAMAPLRLSADGVLWRPLSDHVPRRLSCFLSNSGPPLPALIIDRNSHPHLIVKVVDLFMSRWSVPGACFLWEIMQLGTYVLVIFEDETLETVNAAAIFHVADFAEEAGKTCSGDALLVVGWQATRAEKALGGLGTLAFLSLCEVMLADIGKDDEGGLLRSVHLFMHSVDQARGFWQRLSKFDWHAGAILLNVVESIGRAQNVYEALPAEQCAEIDGSGREHLAFDLLCFECTCTMESGSTEVPAVYSPAVYDSKALKDVFGDGKVASEELLGFRTDNNIRCDALQKSLQSAVYTAKLQLSDWLQQLLDGDVLLNHGPSEVCPPVLDHPMIVYRQTGAADFQNNEDHGLFGDWRFAEVLGYTATDESHWVVYDRWLTGAAKYQHRKHRGKVQLQVGADDWSLVPFDLIKLCM